LNPLTAYNGLMYWSCGKINSVTSSTLHQSSSTNSFPRPHRNGTSTPPSCCCCHTDMRDKDQTTPQRVSNASCSCRPKRTCAWYNPPTVPTTSTCCVNTLTPHRVAQ